MSKPTIEQTRMGAEGIAFCIARTLIERDPSLKAPMRANLRKMWELLEEREDHAAADMVDTMIKALVNLFPRLVFSTATRTIRMFELGHNADWSRTMRSQQFNLRVPAGCRFLPLAG